MQACKALMGRPSWQGRAVGGGWEGRGSGRGKGRGLANVYSSLPFPLPAGVSPFLRLCVDVSTEGKQGRGRASACLPVGLYICITDL